DEVILGDKAHTVIYEAGGISALGGIHSRQIPNQEDGTLALADIQAAIRADDVHQPPTRLIGLENTHNRCGGVALSIEYGWSVKKVADQYGILLHLDGARIFNAAVAQGVAVRALAEPFDSVTFCLSKGLCAPVGAIIVGKRDFIQRVRRVRKQLGGGMRQAGIVAAAGIVALEKMTDRLAEDHIRAQKLADALRKIPGLVLDVGTPFTNMIFFNLSDEFPYSAKWVAEKLKEKNVLVGVVGEKRFRLVTHYWIQDQDVDEAAKVFKEVMSG
ncbi:MAG: GntG family PLP-dependent aldolase, partial [Anaerolineales bacterium]